MMTDEADDRAWIAGLSGGRVERFERTTAGRSRATWLVGVECDDGKTLDLVLRRDTGDGPLSGTELDLAREAVIYRALAGSGVPVPDLIAVTPDGAALLVTRIDGTEDLTNLRGDGLAGVTDSFIDAVATLHNLDVGRLDLPGLALPTAPHDHTATDLALWRRILDTHATRPAPLVRFAFDWLAEHLPTEAQRTVLCHGDLGPGNFLHDGRAVTALLDWEFAHLGDPMDDLAWMTIRSAQVPLHDLDRALLRYSAATGIAVDPDRVAYFQLLVLARMAVACIVALGKRGGRMDASTYLALLPLLERQIVRQLARLADFDLAPTAVLAASEPSPRAEVLEMLSTDLGSVLMPELQTPAARSRAIGMTLLLMHLQTADTLGSTIDESDLDDLEVVLGGRPATPNEGLRVLDSRMSQGVAGTPAALFDYFDRRSARNVALWPIMAAMAERPLPTVLGSGGAPS